MRAKLLEERSSAGYNPINGMSINYVSIMVPKEHRDEFERQTEEYKKKYLKY